MMFSRFVKWIDLSAACYSPFTARAFDDSSHWLIRKDLLLASCAAITCGPRFSSASISGRS